MVRVEGLEPPRLAAPEPKSGASTNFATPACNFKHLLKRAYQKDWQVSSAKRHFLEIFLTTNHKQIKFSICLKFNR